MGKPGGFLEHKRELPDNVPAAERKKHYNEFIKDEEFGDKIVAQASRCMGCGTPFCHQGCPLGNFIPDFNDAVYNNDWIDAFQILSATNNFPEFTGRICPAPCEHSCVLGINQPAVTIENIEKNIVEYAYKNGLVKAQPPQQRTEKRVAVIGSGPAGLAAAAQLNSAGHWVTVFERSNAIGGLLRYGIPDFKLSKWIIDRKLEILQEEGIEFRVNENVGVDVEIEELLDNYHAIVLATGSTVPRDLPAAGRDANGIHFAMDFLARNSAKVQGKKTPFPFIGDFIDAKDKHVIVIGGGDTGSDCIGTANRHGAASIKQFEIMPKPPKERDKNMPWPQYARTLKETSSHEEGCERFWSVLTKEFIKDKEGNLKALKTVDIEWSGGSFKEIAGTEKEHKADLVLLAMGFLHTQHEGLLDKLKVAYDQRGNIAAPEGSYQTSLDGIFSCGDARRGQSLVVWAISEGRECAVSVDKFLNNGVSLLPQKSTSQLISVMELT
ncbi:MAG: glutamate synthase subunit beta [Calditrichae bacterium]|nr:glutamate synthase subunit beta [Calditrichota bacterium]MCB9058979.1 glutamate synthase subunit beta [Calditrichia bacterium]